MYSWLIIVTLTVNSVFGIPKPKENLDLERFEAEKPQNDQTAPACGEGNNTDLIFTFDSSAMGAANSNKIYSFIANVSDHLIDANGNIKTGVVSEYCHDNDVSFDVYETEYTGNSYQSEPKFHSLNHVTKEMRLKSFLPKNGGRNSAKHAAIVLVDEDTEKLNEVALEAAYAKFKKIEMFVVKVGSVDDAILKKIANEPSDKHIWNIESYDDMDSLRLNIFNTFC